MKELPGYSMPPTRKPQNQPIVTAPNEALGNETYTDESEEDIYDNEDHDSLDPFAHAPRMPRYDFAKRKLSQLIGIILDSLDYLYGTCGANIW